MTSAVMVLLGAAGLGLAYNAAPGAVNAEAFRRGLQYGFGSALRVQLGALIGDTSWAIVAVSGASALAQYHLPRLLLGFAGTVFLLWLAASSIRDAWRREARAASVASGRGDFGTGLIFSLANPFALAFWLGVGVSAGGGGVRVAAFLTGFVLGASAWCFGCAALIGGGRKFVRPSLFRVIDACCGALLAYFGLTLLVSTLALI